VSNRTDFLEVVEKQMIELNDGSVDDALSTSEPDNSGMAAPPTKKAKGLSKVLVAVVSLFS